MADRQEQLDRLGKALLRAEERGLADEAQLIAREIRVIQSLPAEGEKGVIKRTDQGVGRGIAKTLGAPTDIVNSMLSVADLGSEKPFGGSEHLMDVMQRIGGAPPEEDLGAAGRVGEVGAMSALTGMAIVVGGLRSLATAAQELGRVPKVFSGIVQDIASTAVRNPTTFAVAEGAAATGAGLASYEATKRWPDSPTAQMLAEIAGGVSPLIALTSARFATRQLAQIAEKTPFTGRMIRSIRGAIKKFSVPAQTQRAEARVARASADPEVSARRLTRDDVLAEAPLTGPARAGDPGLLSLERSVMDETEVLSAVRQKNFADVNQVIRESLTPGTTGEVPTGVTKQYYEMLMDTRIRQAAHAVDEQLAKLGPRATRADLNRLARQELDRAKVASRNHETELYNNIPDNASVPTEASREGLEEILLNTPRAQREDIPAVAQRFLKPTKVNAKGKVVANKEYLGDDTTIEEMRGLYSKLRETSRTARADGRFNEARIADDLAGKITDDIANSAGGAEVREAVDIATTFSSDLNQRFTRGPVGKLLGAAREGGAAIDPSLTLETSLAGRGPRSGVASDALLEAVRRTDVPGIEGEAAMRGHIEGFLIDDFRRQAVSEGRISKTAGAAWLRDNQDVLDRFPELQRDIERAVLVGGQMVDTERLVDPLVSRASVFVKAPLGQEIPRAISTANPRGSMAELVSLARTDPTGQAYQGLKAGFYEHLLKRSESLRNIDINEKPFVSGRKLAEELQRPAIKEAMVGLELTPDEVKHLGKVRETALALERQRLARPADEGIIGDEPNLLFSILARVGGAQIGRVVAGKTGGGTVQTPGILSAQVQRMLKAGVQDPAKRLLTDAIGNEELFFALLVPGQEITGPLQQVAQQRINAWVFDVLRQQYDQEGEDIRTPAIEDVPVPSQAPVERSLSRALP